MGECRETVRVAIEPLSVLPSPLLSCNLLLLSSGQAKGSVSTAALECVFSSSLVCFSVGSHSANCYPSLWFSPSPPPLPSFSSSPLPLLLLSSPSPPPNPHSPKSQTTHWRLPNDTDDSLGKCCVMFTTGMILHTTFQKPCSQISFRRFCVHCYVLTICLLVYLGSY